MNIIIWLIVGGLIGWLASLFMGTDNRQGIILNVVVGVVGAALGGWLLGGAFGLSAISQGSPIGLMVSLVATIILIAMMKFFRGGSLR